MREVCKVNLEGQMKRIIIIIVGIPIIIILIASVIIYKAIAIPANARYVSDKKCYLCHKQQAKSHIKSAHANSFKSLTDNNQDKNPKCLPCHTTGYGKPGGFVDVKSTPDLIGVGCQACHGPGSAHVENGLSKEQKKQNINLNMPDSCQSCHKIHQEHIDIKSK